MQCKDLWSEKADFLQLNRPALQCSCLNPTPYRAPSQGIEGFRGLLTHHHVVANGVTEEADVVEGLRGRQDGQAQTRGGLNHAVRTCQHIKATHNLFVGDSKQASVSSVQGVVEYLCVWDLWGVGPSQPCSLPPPPSPRQQVSPAATSRRHRHMHMHMHNHHTLHPPPRVPTCVYSACQSPQALSGSRSTASKRGRNQLILASQSPCVCLCVCTYIPTTTSRHIE